MNPNISEEAIKLSKDPSIYPSLEETGVKFELTDDQVGELDVEVRKLILGISQEDDFVTNIAEHLEIDKEKAASIATEITSGILKTIRSNPQQPVSKPSGINSSLEKAGGFEIEKDLHDGGEAQSFASKEAASLMGDNKATIMSGIENPVPVTPTPAQAAPVITNTPVVTAPVVATLKNPMKEPLANQLLRSMTGGSIPRPVPKPANPPSNPAAQPPNNLPTKDPYRETLK